ncbi:histidinol-phosphate transaminase [Anaerotalea alkaliphila]|uniref:Histidinol-phosphate aminotransferase n=1 Tax=Anaerotalea alkaliphila TaxID=2662126 RepID=A0A7X5HXX5_9FIRM|nr:histidinol-phosphate transaminase [Anaerotalea alkaliphila]NDL68677.1 histidinol-phosphate transaminase [Anaerotalea alkaliphila]
MMENYLRKELRGFSPYHAPEKPYEVKVDANENPFPHPPEVVGFLQRWMEDKDHLTRYPDTDCSDLRREIAEWYDVDMEEVICGVGSDQLIDAILRVFLEPGDKVLFPDPSFSLYGIGTLLNHGKGIPYGLEEDFSYDLEKLSSLCEEEKPKLVFLCTPNNPTGNVIPPDDISRFLGRVSMPVVVDEAYVEFAGESMASRLGRHPNMIVLRTFSKAYGLAGLRCGYGLASRELISYINLSKPPYNLSAFSQAAAIAVLRNRDFYERQMALLAKERERLAEVLSGFPQVQKIYPSQANFLLFRMADPGLVEALAAKGILVRGYGTQGRLGNCVRVTIGTVEENNLLTAVLKERWNG